MKPRHAAALALVGWYLMTPPANCRTGTPEECPNIGCAFCQSDDWAPLREWTRVPDTQEFEYKTDCERAISNDCRSQVGDDGKSYQEGDLCTADCIAADDPRLKKKLMNLRHAAALVLISWYMMFPPIDPASRFNPRLRCNSSIRKPRYTSGGSEILFALRIVVKSQSRA
jgi:hypothetical protein